MQYVNDINRIKGTEVLVKKEVKNDFVVDLESTAGKTKTEIKNIEFSWLLVQVVLCAIIIGLTLILKEFMPNVYEEFYAEYSRYIEQILLISDGELKIIDNYV